MRRRAVVRVMAIAAMALTGACGGGADGGGRGTAVVEGYGEVAPQYESALARRLTEGRAVTEQLVFGELAPVYDRSAPQVKQSVSLAEAARLFTDLRSRAMIGSRQAERALPLGSDRGVYWADYGWGEGRLRFTVVFTSTGLIPTVEPVTALPPDPRAGRPTETTDLRFPFEGLWWVSEAPEPELGAHHLVAPHQRHAFDFSVWRDGGTYRGTGAANEEYWCWGQEVLAPADGRVTSVQDGVADNRPWVETNEALAAGNHVVLDLGSGEYAALAHFQKGSMRVALGDTVRAGDVLGLCGNSGNSNEPHVHFHLQDKPAFFADGAVGVPARFRSFQADGVDRNRTVPFSGQFVAAGVARPVG
jgi:hypothetical protein